MNDSEVVIQLEQSIVEIQGSDLAVVDREIVSIVSEGIQGPAGADGGGLAAVEDDPAPALGGDLDLNGFQVRGTINNDDFTLDCGLL